MSRQVVYETSLVVFLCVLSLFLYPAATGPYPAVHGPATTLRAATASTQIAAVMADALRSFVSRPLFASNEIWSRIAAFNGEPPLVMWHGAKDILRC